MVPSSSVIRILEFGLGSDLDIFFVGSVRDMIRFAGAIVVVRASLPIGSRNSLTNHRLWNGKYFTIRVVETASQSPSKLDVLLLVFSNRDVGRSGHDKRATGATRPV
jgi:hypothetical protein